VVRGTGHSQEGGEVSKSAGVEKICIVCRKKFIDYSRNKSKNTCSNSCRYINNYKDPEKNFEHKFELRLNVLRLKGITFNEETIKKIKNDLRVGRCQICGKKIPDFRNRHIDHDHVSQAYRGVLCNKCNSGVGFLQDNPVIAERMIAYLHRSDSIFIGDQQ